MKKKIYWQIVTVRASFNVTEHRDLYERCQLIFRIFACCRLVGAFPIPSSPKNKAHIDMVHTHMKNKHRKRDLLMERGGGGIT